MWTLSESAHSDNLKPTKIPKPIKLGLLEIHGFNPHKTKLNKTHQLGHSKENWLLNDDRNLSGFNGLPDGRCNVR